MHNLCPHPLDQRSRQADQLQTGEALLYLPYHVSCEAPIFTSKLLHFAGHYSPAHSAQPMSSSLGALREVRLSR